MRAIWLAEVLRAAGLQVIELDGWRGRGHELTTINGVVEHDTVTGTNWTDESVAHLLRDGRPDLAGPLAQLGLDRHGRYWLVADGKCNHNGFGLWANQAIGIEAFNDAHEPWPAEQVDALVRGTAAILQHLGLNEGHALGHKETDPKRKQDPSNFDMAAFRRHVAALLRPTQETLLMAIAKDDDDLRRTFIRQWCLDYWGREPSVDEQNILVFGWGLDGHSDLALAAVADHPNAAAFRAKRGW